MIFLALLNWSLIPNRNISLALVPTRSSLFLLQERDTTIVDGQLDFGRRRLFYFWNLSFQIIMLPRLSPEMKDSVSFLLQIAETEPLWPVTAFTQVYFYQKYREPLPIPEMMYYLF
jgi:hypothetical protein